MEEPNGELKKKKEKLSKFQRDWFVNCETSKEKKLAATYYKAQPRKKQSNHG